LQNDSKERHFTGGPQRQTPEQHQIYAILVSVITNLTLQKQFIHHKNMYPIIDIRVPSPAIKPTHGSKLPIKAPLARFSPEPHTRKCWQPSTVVTSKWGSWQALLLFDEEEKEEVDVREELLYLQSGLAFARFSEPLAYK